MRAWLTGTLVLMALLLPSGRAAAETATLDLGYIDAASREGETHKSLELPQLDLAIGDEVDGVSDVEASARGTGEADSDGRYDSPYGRYRLISPLSGIATWEGDGSQRIELGTRIEVLSEIYKVPTEYVITLVTTLPGDELSEGEVQVVIEGARIDPKDPEGKRTLDPFRIVLPGGVSR